MRKGNLNWRIFRRFAEWRRLPIGCFLPSLIGWEWFLQIGSSPCPSWHLRRDWTASEWECWWEKLFNISNQVFKEWITFINLSFFYRFILNIFVHERIMIKENLFVYKSVRYVFQCLMNFNSKRFQLFFNRSMFHCKNSCSGCKQKSDYVYIFPVDFKKLL